MPFVFSSFTGLPKLFFDGYCFVGPDFIFGMDGMSDYVAQSGRPVGPGEDGCYVSISEENGVSTAGVDSGGLRKIYYYARNGVWCLSDSLVEVVEHLRGRGIKLAAQEAQMHGLRLFSPMTSQLSCFQTIIDGVRMLPSSCVLTLRGNQLALSGARSPHSAAPTRAPSGTWLSRSFVRLTGFHNRPSGKPASYADRLASYLESWVSRFETLLADDRVLLSADLTGGRDSRANFAMLQRARARLGRSGATILLQSSEAERWAPDLRVAQAIAPHYGLTVNGSVPSSRRGPRRVSGREAFETWRRLCLGVYHPVYLPRRGPDPFRVHVHGGGGENHRPFYLAEDPEAYLARLDPQRPSALHQRWKDEVLGTMQELRQANPKVPPLISHYREFRNRMHGGVQPNYHTVVSPLSSARLQAASDATDLADGQVNFDIMENLVPGLMMFEYDAKKKAPSPSNLKSLTRVPVSDEPAPGRIYAGIGPEDDPPMSSEGDRLSLLSDAYQDAKTGAVVDFFGAGFLQEADDALAKAHGLGRFSPATQGGRVSRVLSASLALSG